MTIQSLKTTTFILEQMHKFEVNIVMKYAIKVPFGNPEDPDSWIYVTNSNSPHFEEIKVQLYDSLEQAEKAAKIWRIHEIVEYSE